jgi:hypothetical protein
MPEKNDTFLNPLADPVVSAIFANKEVVGLAAASLISATLKADNQDFKIGEVLSITPQRSYIDAFKRGCRMDIKVETANKEIFVFEVEVAPSKIIIQRNLFAASHIYTKTSEKGDTAEQMAGRMPKVIFINILGYNVRKDSKDILQPFGIMYTKPPIDQAASNFSGYDVQLPCVMDMEPDFDDEFYCWCYTLYKSYHDNKTIQEVVEMTPQLQLIVNSNMGYQQFCERYKLVTADPDAREEYVQWRLDRMKEEGLIMYAREEEREKAAKEKFEDKRHSIMKMTRSGMDDVTIADYLNIPIADLTNYRQAIK